MPLSTDLIQSLADELHNAERDGTQIAQFSLRHPEITIEDAYAIQRAWTKRKIAEGRKAIGHKIGLTSRAMQRSSNIDEPDYGLLLDDMLFPDGRDIPIDRFIVPRVEVELAFRLKQPLSGPNCTMFDVLDAVDYIIPAIEIRSIAPPARRARCSTRFRTMPPMPASCSAGDRSGRATSTCAGSRR